MCSSLTWSDSMEMLPHCIFIGRRALGSANTIKHLNNKYLLRLLVHDFFIIAHDMWTMARKYHPDSLASGEQVFSCFAV